MIVLLVFELHVDETWNVPILQPPCLCYSHINEVRLGGGQA